MVFSKRWHDLPLEVKHFIRLCHISRHGTVHHLWSLAVPQRCLNGTLSTNLPFNQSINQSISQAINQSIRPTVRCPHSTCRHLWARWSLNAPQSSQIIVRVTLDKSFCWITNGINIVLQVFFPMPLVVNLSLRCVRVCVCGSACVCIHHLPGQLVSEQSASVYICWLCLAFPLYARASSISSET